MRLNYENVDTGVRLYTQIDPNVYPNKGDTVKFASTFYVVVRIVINPMEQMVTALIEER